MVYLMENKMPYGRVVGIKVGSTDDIKKRKAQYRTHNPYANMLEYKKGGKAKEREYQRCMEDSNLFKQVGKTEWFEIIDKELINGIEKNGFRFLDAMFGT